MNARLNPAHSVFARITALTAACALISLFSCPTAAAEQRCGPQAKPQFSAIYVFGDSLSDTGNCLAVTGWPPAPYFFQGRECDGPIWPDYLAPMLGLAYDPWDNFAFNGAGTGRYNAWEPDFQVDLPGMLDELDEYELTLGHCRKADRDALYVVFGGANDAFRIIAQQENWKSSVRTSVGNIIAIVCDLRRRGAEHILVADLPDIGLTPRLQDLGLGDVGSQLSVYYNGVLNCQLDELHVNLIRVSVFDLMNDFVAHPGRYGFSNVTDAALDGALDPTYLFWDPVHPGSLAHLALADCMMAAIDDAAADRHGHRWPACGPAHRADVHLAD